MANGGRCILEEGHEPQSAGTHCFAPPLHPALAFARSVSDELGARLRIPCTDVAATPSPPLCLAPMWEPSMSAADPAPPRCDLPYGHDPATFHHAKSEGRNVAWPSHPSDDGARRVVARDEGDVTCAQADESPEAALYYAVGRIVGATNNARDRVLSIVLGFLRTSERDWTALAHRALSSLQTDGILEAKSLHDAQLIELFQAIGGAL